MGSSCVTCLKEETTEKRHKKPTQQGKKNNKSNEAEKLVADAVASLVEEIEFGQHDGEIPTHVWRFKKGFGSPTVAVGSVEGAAQKIASALGNPPVDPREKIVAANAAIVAGGGAAKRAKPNRSGVKKEEEELKYRKFKTNAPLTSLNLSGQRLGNEGCRTICQALASCGPKSVGAPIKSLNLKKNDLTDDGAVELCDALKKKGNNAGGMAPLKVLSLEENALTSVGLVQVCTLISSSPELEYLSFSIAAGAEVDQSALAILHESLAHTDSLKTWKFSRVGSGGSSAASVASVPTVGDPTVKGATPPAGVTRKRTTATAATAGAMRKKDNAVGVVEDAAQTERGDTGDPFHPHTTAGGFTPSTLQNFFEKMLSYQDRVGQLTTMGLYDCISVSASGELIAMVAPVRSLGRWLKSMYCRLTYLELKLPLGDKGAEVLAMGFDQYSSLESLTLSRCSIGHAGVAAIGDGLAKNTGLTRLDLSHQPGLLDHLKVNEASLVKLAGALSVNSTLTELNILGLGMPRLATEAFISALGANAAQSQLTSFSHCLIPDDKMGVQLAGLLRATKKRLGLSVGSSSLASQASFGTQMNLDFDDAASDFSVEDDDTLHDSPKQNKKHQAARNSKNGVTSSSPRQRGAGRAPVVTSEVFSPLNSSLSGRDRSPTASSSKQKTKKTLRVVDDGAQGQRGGGGIDDGEIDLVV